MEQLKQSGIIHGEKTDRLTVKAFISNAPAREFVKCVNRHSGYHSFEWCAIRGAYVERRVVLGATAPGAGLRSEAEFNKFENKDHQSGKYPLITAGIPSIQLFAQDYMHLVCVGVVRRIGELA